MKCILSNLIAIWLWRDLRPSPTVCINLLFLYVCAWQRTPFRLKSRIYFTNIVGVVACRTYENVFSYNSDFTFDQLLVLRMGCFSNSSGVIIMNLFRPIQYLQPYSLWYARHIDDRECMTALRNEKSPMKWKHDFDVFCSPICVNVASLEIGQSQDDS